MEPKVLIRTVIGKSENVETLDDMEFPYEITIPQLSEGDKPILYSVEWGDNGEVNILVGGGFSEITTYTNDLPMVDMTPGSAPTGIRIRNRTITGAGEIRVTVIYGTRHDTFFIRELNTLSRI